MNIVKMLKKEAQGLEEKVQVLHRAIVILNGHVSSGSGSGNGKPGNRRGRRAGWKMSKSARMKIAKAQRERWAKQRRGAA